MYPLLKEKREEIHEFIEEWLRKECIRPLKSPQMASVFFIEKNNEKERMTIYI